MASTTNKMLGIMNNGLKKEEISTYVSKKLVICIYK